MIFDVGLFPQLLEPFADEPASLFLQHPGLETIMLRSEGGAVELRFREQLEQVGSPASLDGSRQFARLQGADHPDEPRFTSEPGDRHRAKRELPCLGNGHTGNELRDLREAVARRKFRPRVGGDPDSLCDLLLPQDERADRFLDFVERLDSRVFRLDDARGRYFSFLKSTFPAFASLTAFDTSKVTVPTLGLGINPRGPNIFPNFPTMLITSGVAITLSNSIQPP